MHTRIETDGQVMTVYLEGELDHHNAPAAREKIDEFAVGFHPAHTILDFGGVTFMDSPVLGLSWGAISCSYSFPARWRSAISPRTPIK